MSRIQELVDSVRKSERSSFYSGIWKDVGQFEDLPEVTRADFIRVPLLKRRYKEESSLVKIVHGEKPFLSECSFADISKEEFGLASLRPLVYMADAYEAIEKSMWCYGGGMVPLIGEKDPDIAMYAAGKYQVDSLITDPEAVLKLRPYLETHRVSAISVIGESFDLDALAPFSAYTDQLRLVLAVPEIGAFATATFARNPKYAAVPGCMIERRETLVVTKDRMLMTPVIKYRTEMDAKLYDGA